MAIRKITPNTQDAPQLGQSEAVFEDNASHMFGDYMPQFVDELNLTTTDIDDTLDIMNLVATGDTSQSQLAGHFGNLSSPLCLLLLKNNIDFKGAGSVTFSRDSTATYIDRYGALRYASIDEPRFEKEGLLIEGEGTNYIPTSNVFNGTDSYWGEQDISIVNNTTTSPDGTTNAHLLTPTSTAGNIRVQGIGATANLYSFSVFLKAGTSDRVRLVMNNATDGFDTADFIFSTKQWDYVNSNFNTKYEELADGWYRLTISTISAQTAINTDFRIYPSPIVGTETVYAFGAQVEALPFATSYIPTTTTAVTRGSDTFSLPAYNNAVDLNDSDFSIFVKFKPESLDTAGGFKLIFQNNIHNDCAIIQVDDTIRMKLGSASRTITTLTSLDEITICVTWESSGATGVAKGYLNGELQVTESETTNALNQSPSVANIEIMLGVEGYISTLATWDTLLTATEVALLG